MRDELEHTLSGWNGKATQPLKTAYETLRTEPALVDLLIDLRENQSCERGATWLLKYAFDRDPPTLSNAQSARHLAGISGFGHWETRLHFLQYLERLTIPDDAEAPLLDFILDALAAENRFLRAWAYFGLALHSERFPAHRDQAIDRLNEAMARETAGSVTVRIRKALERIAP